MTINWVRFGLAVFVFILVFTTPREVSFELVRLFKLLFLLFSILIFGLAFEVKHD